MRAFAKTTAEWTLILTENEALWLSTLVQNTLSADESALDREMRRVFWNALNPGNRVEIEQK